jgi:hypothetical protein
MIQSGLVIFAIIILTIVLFGVYEYHIHKTIPIPRKIWTFQEDGVTYPKTSNLCIQSWKKHHPSYEIIILTRKTAKGYVRIPEEILSHPSFQGEHFWELVCLYALTEQGGIWMDPSIIIKKRMEDWLFPRKGEFSGFYHARLTPKDGIPIMESSFLSSQRGSQFLTQWRNEFASVAQYPTIEKYVESRKKMGVDLTPFHDPIQQVMQVAAQKVLQYDNYDRDSILLQSVEEGPLRYLTDTKGDVEKGLQLACMVPRYQFPILMLQREGQKIMEQEVDDLLSMNRCKWLD